MKNKTLALILAATTVMAVALTGCGSNDTSSSNTTTEETTTTADASTDDAEEASDDADAEDDAAGFTEYPIFEDEEIGFLNVSGVYFQAVPMTGGYENIDGYDIHIEADVSALENDLGFGTGDWVPYLNVSYKITNNDSGEVAAEGNFMPMSASDGPHYGANIALSEAATYTVEFTFSAQDDVYLIHTDSTTGPGSTFAEAFAEPLVVKYDSWDYTPLQP